MTAIELDRIICLAPRYVAVCQITKPITWAPKLTKGTKVAYINGAWHQIANSVGIGGVTIPVTPGGHIIGVSHMKFLGYGRFYENQPSPRSWRISSVLVDDPDEVERRRKVRYGISL